MIWASDCTLSHVWASAQPQHVGDGLALHHAHMQNFPFTDEGTKVLFEHRGCLLPTASGKDIAKLIVATIPRLWGGISSIK